MIDLKDMPIRYPVLEEKFLKIENEINRFYKTESNYLQYCMLPVTKKWEGGVPNSFDRLEPSRIYHTAPYSFGYMSI